MSESQVIRSKKSQNLSWGQNLSLGQKFLAAEFFSLHRIIYGNYNNRYWYVFASLVAILQFCGNSGIVVTSGVMMLFCPLLADWIVCRIGIVRQKTWSYSTWFGKCSIHYAYKVSTLWSSQVWLYCGYLCAYQYIIPKVKQRNILKFWRISAWVCFWVNLNT